MYLHSLTIEGFRGLEHLSLRFREGLNLIVGPNNAGKTAVIDALRVLLSAGDEGALRVSDFDLHVRADKSVCGEATFRYVFRGLTVEEEADFIQALKPYKGTGKDAEYEAHISVRFIYVEGASRLHVKKWVGGHEETTLTTDMMENLRAVYLPPLRDPAQGLKPGRASQLARLMQVLSDPAAQKQIVKALEGLDQELKKTQSITDTKDAITKRHTDMLGGILSQDIEVSLSPSDFKKVAARLGMLISSFEVEQNGLGFNNLIYMAVVLSELSLSKDSAYRALLVEEPEAHLHPQLQAILLKYLQSVEKPTEGEKSVQVFLTSHSPNFTALADIDSLACVYQGAAGPASFFPRETEFESRLKEKLQRYLNVTRAEIFFARRILLVEGAAELFLIEVMAKLIKLDLRKNAVSVISTDGLNFDAFIPLFGKDQLQIRVSVLSDSDEKGFPARGAAPQLSAAAKLTQGKANHYVKTFFGLKTFEYALALEPANQQIMLDALADINPGIAKDLREQVAATAEPNRPKVLYEGMFDRGETKANVQKGAFAQSLAQAIELDKKPFVVPQYIQDALQYICEP